MLLGFAQTDGTHFFIDITDFLRWNDLTGLVSILNQHQSEKEDTDPTDNLPLGTLISIFIYRSSRLSHPHIVACLPIGATESANLGSNHAGDASGT